jgi:hypothetical protein
MTLPYNYVTNDASILMEIISTESARVIQFVPLSSVWWQEMYQKPYRVKIQGDKLHTLCSVDFDITETTSGRNSRWHAAT